MKWSRAITIGFWFIAALFGLLLSIFVAISYGAKEMTLGTVWDAVFRFDRSLASHLIVHELRLPRVLGAVCTGMAFAVAGAIMQGVTRNSMADTGILGVNAGAAFVVALCFAFLPGLSYASLMAMSFVGALLSTLFILLLGTAAPGGLSSLTLTIAGAVTSAILHSLSAGVAIYFGLNQDLAFWYAGGVAGVKWEHLRWLAPIVAAAVVWAFLLGRSITFLSLGDETAVNLGVRTTLTKVLAMTAAVVLAGASVSVAGSISFVGLVVPHIARKLVGVDYRLVIPMSGILGAVLLVCADFASRMVNPPRELAIGAMVALVGVPFFLYLARKERREL
ncbi:MAG: iron compound transporter, permease protein [Paenibacillus sp.]|jgi:iron complex transport system permease protein|nr:iron compound transporter, permease protein [Paenibacillus sp.]